MIRRKHIRRISAGLTTFLAMTCLVIFVFALFIRLSYSELYSVPVPQIVAFNTGGLRVSIPEKPGIKAIYFHANINHEIEQLHPGRINMETQEKTNGRWVLEDRTITLKLNDIIYYWLFVEQGRFGYVKHPKAYKIKGLTPYTGDEISSSAEITTTPTTPTSSVEETIINIVCYNTTRTLLILQNQVESLTKTVDLLTGVVENFPDFKKLRLSGSIPIEDDPSRTVRFILWEKLDLQPHIVLALKNSDGSITFEVETLQEKLEIMKAAKVKLRNSRIVIS